MIYNNNDMKLKRIKVKNFKSFVDNEFEFDANTNANYIFGENGAGKTTFISLSSAISEIITKELNLFNYSKLPPFIKETQNRMSFTDIYSNYKTLWSDEEIFLSFLINDRKTNQDVEYTIGMISGDIVTQEKMVVKDLNNGKEEIIFKKKLGVEFYAVEDLFKWTKLRKAEINKNTSSSILSLAFLWNAVEAKDSEEIWDSINPFNIFLKAFLVSGDLTIHELSQLVEYGNTVIAKDIEGVNINLIDTYDFKLEKIEKFIESFSVFVSSIDDSIKDVKLKILQDNKLSTTLSYSFFKDMGNNKIREIPFILESQGTRKFMSIFRTIKNIQEEFNENIIFLDEIGAFFHESLIAKIINYINDNAIKYDKHIFITTHNSIALNDRKINRIPKNANKEKNFLNRSKVSGKITISNIKNVNQKVNNQEKFLNGEYGASPNDGPIYTDKDE